MACCLTKMYPSGLPCILPGGHMDDHVDGFGGGGVDPQTLITHEKPRAGHAENFPDTHQESTMTTRETVETITFGTTAHYEVETFAEYGKPQWRTINNRVGEPQVFDTVYEAKEYAAEYGKLYHADTRVVKVSA